MSKPNVFVFAFAQDGFETIVNLTALDEKMVLAKLADETPLDDPPGKIMNFLKMRAWANAERRYEIWVLGADQGVTEEDLWEWARRDPQDLVDRLRSRGTPYHRPYPKEDAIIK